MKDLIESILTITDDPRRDYRSDDVVEQKLFELLTMQLHKHDVSDSLVSQNDIQKEAEISTSDRKKIISELKHKIIPYPKDNLNSVWGEKRKEKDL